MRDTVRGRLFSKQAARLLCALLAAGLLLLGACLPKSGSSTRKGGTRVITLYGFSVMKEVMDKAVIPAFTEKWKREQGEDVRFVTSYAGSETITNQILQGVGADLGIFSGVINLEELTMRRRVFIPAVLALAAAAAALLGACKATDTAGNVSAAGSKAGQKSSANAPTGTTEVHADVVRRVGPGELKELLDAGSAALYDTRAKTAYDAEHITGALSMPYDEVSKRVGELPKDKTLVFYCTWPNEHTSAGAALTLKQQKIENTAALLGGMQAWKNAGLPTEKSQ